MKRILRFSTLAGTLAAAALLPLAVLQSDACAGPLYRAVNGGYEYNGGYAPGYGGYSGYGYSTYGYGRSGYGAAYGGAGYGRGG